MIDASVIAADYSTEVELITQIKATKSALTDGSVLSDIQQLLLVNQLVILRTLFDLLPNE
jgi:hypothetical protein